MVVVKTKSLPGKVNLLSSVVVSVVTFGFPFFLVLTSVDDQVSSHAPHWIGPNPVFGSILYCSKAALYPASISVTFAFNFFSSNQTSLFGFNSTPPTQVIAANGFTFSVLVANFWSIKTSSS